MDSAEIQYAVVEEIIGKTGKDSRFFIVQALVAVSPR